MQIQQRPSRAPQCSEIARKAFNSAHVPAIREPPGLCRRDGKRPDGLTLVPWVQCKFMVWDVTVVDALAPHKVESFEPLKAAEVGKKQSTGSSLSPDTPLSRLLSRLKVIVARGHYAS